MTYERLVLKKDGEREKEIDIQVDAVGSLQTWQLETGPWTLEGGWCQIYNAESHENPHKPLKPIVLHPPTAFLFKNKGD